MWSVQAADTPYTIKGVSVEEEEEIASLVRNGKPLHKHHMAFMLAAFINSPALLAMVDRAKADLEQVRGLYQTMLELAIRSEYFTFGRIDELEVVRLGKERMRLMMQAGVRYPYRHCVFHAVPLSNALGKTVNMFQFVLDMTNEEDLAEGIKFRVCIAEFACMESTQTGQALFAPTVLVECIDTGVKVNSTDEFSLKIRLVFHNVQKQNGELDEKEAPARIKAVLAANAYMNMLLHTKGLKVERVHPAVQLNKARAKRGKPFLMPYTIVHTERFTHAMRETERMEREGKRLSPRPHLRRGHPRHYQDGRTIWIHDMIIGCRDENDFINLREGYKVK